MNPAVLPPPATPTTQRLMELENWCRGCWEAGYSDDALALEGALSLVRVARTLKEKASLAFGLRFAATVVVSRGDFGQALEHLFESLELFIQVGNLRQVAACQVEIGRVYLEFGDYADALDYFEASLETCKAFESVHGPQTNLFLIAQTQKNLGDLSKALDYAEKSCTLAHQLKNEAAICEIFTFVGEVHALSAAPLLAAGENAAAQHMLEQSRTSLEEALQIARKRQDLEAQTATLTVLTTTLCKLGRFDEALRTGQQAIQGSLELENPAFKADALLAVGQLQVQSGHWEAALEVLERSLGMFESLGQKNKMAFVHRKLTDLHKSRQNHRQALQHFEEFYELDAQIRDQSAAHRARALTVKLDLEQARHESELHRMRAIELSDLNAQLERQALHDPLTGLPNRRSLEAFCGEHWPTLAGAPWCVVIVDADHFKLVNDRFSHAVGDLVLQELASIMREHCKADELAARFGGEEFILIWRARGHEVFERCERLRLAVIAHPWQELATNLQVTLSLGWCDQPVGGFNEMFSRADSALYQAKQSGRNQVMPKVER